MGIDGRTCKIKNVKYILILVFSCLLNSVKAQCKLRLINSTDSVLVIEITRLKINVILNPHDTTKYYSVDSLLKQEGYILSVDGDKYQSNKGKDNVPIKKGTWEMSFRWSDRRQSWISLMNQTID